ncbi:hypothetical protein [Deinococcus planocerae]|uniref:hypothetical protein n=1 Tax=Deinococcus planocerae TaxID=1737569 RepID=UPI0011AEE4D5|nr:hypothetical protein [Deinococcus planocerae]
MRSVLFLVFLFVAGNALFLSFVIVRAFLTAVFDRQGRHGARVGVASMLVVAGAALAVFFLSRRAGGLALGP